MKGLKFIHEENENLGRAILVDENLETYKELTPHQSERTNWVTSLGLGFELRASLGPHLQSILLWLFWRWQS
jgi:hypothetical protein